MRIISLFFILIMLVLLIGIVVSIIVIKNKIITMRQRCYNARAQITVALETKWNMIRQLVDTVKMCSEDESIMLQKIISARSELTTINKISEDYEISEGTFNHLLILAEEYPTLRTIDAYVKLMNEIKKREDVLTKSKMIYNDCVMKYNRFVSSFPVNLLKEKEEPYWDN